VNFLYSIILYVYRYVHLQREAPYLPVPVLRSTGTGMAERTTTLLAVGRVAPEKPF
jgi:hypothetical protein